MDPQRFDRLATALAGRLSRRTALTAGSGGLAATLLGLAGLHHPPATAQDATPGASPIASPVASPGATPVAGTAPQLLFVQTFRAATWTAKPGEPGAYTLTLTGHAAQTLYFADRPARDVGTLPTRDFLDQHDFAPTDPPNAAVVVRTADGGEDVLVVELVDPVYAEGFGEERGVTVTYTARVLRGEPGARLASLAARQGDAQLPEAFGPASLFIDSPKRRRGSDGSEAAACLPEGSRSDEPGQCCSQATSKGVCCGSPGGTCAASGCCAGHGMLVCTEGMCRDLGCLPEGTRTNTPALCCSQATSKGVCCGSPGDTCATSRCCAGYGMLVCTEGMCVRLAA